MDVAAPGGGILANLESLRGRRDPEAVRAAVKEMESLFAYELVKAMRRTTPGMPGSRGFGGDVYGTLFDMELGRIVAERGLGLREMLLRELVEAPGRGGSNPPAAEGRPVPPAGSAAEQPGAGSMPGGNDSGPGPAEQGGSRSAPDLRSFVLDGGRLSSSFGMRIDPLSGTPKFHHGVDIAAAEGTPIHPVCAGTVVFSGRQPGYGNVVVVDHGDGLASRYAHNCVNLVREGESVGPDSVIALVGNTGRSTGPHLHFELVRDGRPVDPAPALAGRPVKEIGAVADNAGEGVPSREGAG